MCNACTPILVGVTSPVSEILLLSKTAKFPFLTMGVKKLNQVESAHKILIMQVGIVHAYQLSSLCISHKTMKYSTQVFTRMVLNYF